MFDEQGARHEQTVNGHHSGSGDIHPYTGASAPPTEKLKQVRTGRPAHQPSNCTCSLICRWKSSLADCALIHAYRKFGSRVILWKNPYMSGSVLLSSLAVIASLKYWSALTALSFWMLAIMIISALYKLTSTIVVSVLGYSMPALPSMLTERWKLPDTDAEKFVDNVITRTNSALDELQRVLLWDKVMHSLLFVGFLFIAFHLGRRFDMLTLLLINVVTLFTVPALLDRNQDRIERMCRAVKNRMCRTKSSIADKLPHSGGSGKLDKQE